jgi:hypothetical protein
MTDTLKNCTVASYTRCNSATIPSENATEYATNTATIDLFALSAQVLRRNQCNQERNSNATMQLHGHATDKNCMAGTFSKKSCAVALPKKRNYATEQLRALIRKVSVSYGGDDEIFLEEYIDDVIREWSHDLDKAIACFNSLSIRR